MISQTTRWTLVFLGTYTAFVSDMHVQNACRLAILARLQTLTNKGMTIADSLNQV